METKPTNENPDPPLADADRSATITCNCQDRIAAVLAPEGAQPSAGHDWVDEIIGLLRVARGQRDTAETQVRALEHALRNGSPPNAKVRGGGE